jgi:hypothetical protein
MTGMNHHAWLKISFEVIQMAHIVKGTPVETASEKPIQYPRARYGGPCQQFQL